MEWREAALSELPLKHQLCFDTATWGGRARLLDLAAELIRLMDQDPHCRAAAAERVPMEGRLRCWSLYQPTKSEFLVAPILRPIGHVTWQPERARRGADYKVAHRSGVLVAEVKRVCTRRRHEWIATQRVLANMGGSGPIFTKEENRANEQVDARRLYKHVRNAADQLKTSAKKAASKGAAPGVLFLDLDGNTQLVNLADRVRAWMELPWAASIDLVLWFDYRPREGKWGTIAKPLYRRTKRALHAFARAHEPCTRGHVHVGNAPVGPCEYDVPL